MQYTVYLTIFFSVAGQMLYEMASGKELQPMTPREEDLSEVNDNDLRDLLRYVFIRNDEKFLYSIEDVWKISA